jgi:hypothetical protein
MVKIDLQDAYFLVAVTLEHRKFLRFFWKDVLYEYSCLPFGLSSAPRVFTKLLKPVVAYLRELGIRLVIYLDDLLILNDSISGLLHDLRIVINLLESLGFIVNFEKSIVFPQQQIEYLGMIIDSKAQKFSLPTDKVVSIVNQCKNILKADESGQVKLRDLAKVMGSFSFTIPSIPYAQDHYRKLQSFFINQSHTHKDLKKTVCLPAGARFDLQWWASNLEQSNGKMFCSLNPDLEYFQTHLFKGGGRVRRFTN